MQVGECVQLSESRPRPVPGVILQIQILEEEKEALVKNADFHSVRLYLCGKIRHGRRWTASTPFWPSKVFISNGNALGEGATRVATDSYQATKHASRLVGWSWRAWAARSSSPRAHLLPYGLGPAMRRAR